MKIPFSMTRKAILALVAVSMVGTAAALVGLFTHTFPQVTVVQANAVTTCAALTLSTSTVVAGTSGTLTATCGANPAFTVAAVTGGAILTPNFNLPTGYTALAVIPTASPCPTVLSPPAAQITSAASFGFSASGGTFDYCIFYVNPTTNLASFFVTWSQ